MVPRSLPARVALAACCVVLLAPATSFGQASRTWTSGVGDDVNPCSRTAPCKTFAGTISKTAAGGEIDALDPGGFGAVTITKSITIAAASGMVAGIAATGTNGVLVNAPVGSTVILRNLDINGFGIGQVGVHIIGGGTVRIEKSAIYGFRNAGIDIQPSLGSMKVFVTDTSVRDIGGNGVVAAPPNPATPNGFKVTVRLLRDTIEHTTCGVVATVFGLPNTAAFASNCGTPSSPGNIAAGAQITSIDTQISGSSGFGVLSNGPGANNDMAGHVVTGNDTGLGVLNGGTIALVAAGNDLFDNTHNGAPTSSVALTQGPAGATGATGGSGADGGGGDKGSPGQQGATGKTGPSGPAGQVRIVSCHQTPSGQKCSATLESSPVKVTADRAVTRVVLARAGRVSARGTLRRSHLALTSSRRLVAGRYVMTIWRHGRLAGRINVVLGVSHA